MPYKNRIKRNEYMREYSQRSEVKKYRKEYMKEYVQKLEAKKKHREYSMKYVKKYPKKQKAHNEAYRKLKHLKKPGFEFHHPDYNQPLNVIVMPIAEHRALHNHLNHMREAVLAS